MDLGWNLPAPCSLDELVDVLEDALLIVRARDSFEGTITWSMPTSEPWLTEVDEEAVKEGVDPAWARRPTADFGLVARYRIGNSMGQGGLRVFTKPAPEDLDESWFGHPDLHEAVSLTRWLASLGDDGNPERQTVTLQQIIDRAQGAFTPEAPS